MLYEVITNMIAHADNARMVGVNYKGKVDVSGKPFRDQLIVITSYSIHYTKLYDGSMHHTRASKTNMGS